MIIIQRGYILTRRNRLSGIKILARVDLKEGYLIKLGVGSNSIDINSIGNESIVYRPAERLAMTVAILGANPHPIAFAVILTETKGMFLIFK